MLKTSGASSGPSTEWMQQRDQRPVPNARQEVPPLGEALSKHTSHLGMRTAGELQHSGHGAPADRKTFKMKGGEASLEDLWGLRLGWGPWGCRRWTGNRAAERPQSCRQGRQAVAVVTCQLLCAELVTGRRHSPAEKCGEPRAIRACGPSPPLPSIQPGMGGMGRTSMSSPYPGQLLPPGPAPPEEGAPKR